MIDYMVLQSLSEAVSNPTPIVLWTDSMALY